jgi:hypothetical protein
MLWFPSKSNGIVTALVSRITEFASACSSSFNLRKLLENTGRRAEDNRAWRRRLIAEDQLAQSVPLRMAVDFQLLGSRLAQALYAERQY